MVFSGNGWSCIKEVMPPDMFDGEYGVALLPVQENQASSRGKGEGSWFFSSCNRNWGYLSSYNGDGPSKLEFYFSDVWTTV